MLRASPMHNDPRRQQSPRPTALLNNWSTSPHEDHQDKSNPSRGARSAHHATRSAHAPRLRSVLCGAQPQGHGTPCQVPLCTTPPYSDRIAITRHAVPAPRRGCATWRRSRRWLCGNRSRSKITRSAHGACPDRCRGGHSTYQARVHCIAMGTHRAVRVTLRTPERRRARSDRMQRFSCARSDACVRACTELHRCDSPRAPSPAHHIRPNPHLCRARRLRRARGRAGCGTLPHAAQQLATVRRCGRGR